MKNPSKDKEQHWTGELCDIVDAHCEHNCHTEKNCGCMFYRIEPLMEKIEKQAIKNREGEIIEYIEKMKCPCLKDKEYPHDDCLATLYVNRTVDQIKKFIQKDK